MTSLSDESRKAVDEYLQKLEEKLGELPDDERADAVAETRSHIEEAVARIQEDEAAAVGTVLRGLGEPEAFAEGLVSGDAPEEPAAKAQPVPVTPAAAPAKSRTPWGWCIAGCIALPVLLAIPLLLAYFWMSSVPTDQVLEQQRLIELKQQEAVWTEEMRMLDDQLILALRRRDAKGLSRMLHPELVAEEGVTGEDLLPHRFHLDPSLEEMVRLEDGSISITLRAGDHRQWYLLRLHDGEWRIRDFQRDAAP